MGGAHDRAQPVDVGAREHAVAPDVGDDHRGRAGRRECSHEVEEPRPRALDPAAHAHLAVAVVEADGHAAGVTRAQSPDEVGVLDRRGADHDPAHTRVEERLRGGIVAHPAATLDRRLHGGRDRSDQLAVVARAPRRVEVDHVDPRGARGLVVLGDRDRVVAIGGLAPEVALDQVHHASAAQVDGRVEVHQKRRARSHTATKLRSRCSPADPDFSGWNCVAHTLSRSTAATTGPP